MKVQVGEILRDTVFKKYSIDIEAKKDEDVIKISYRKVNKGERVNCIVHPTLNYILSSSYYESFTSDGYDCFVSSSNVRLIE